MAIITTRNKPKAERVTSSVSFPYSDIDDAIAVAEVYLKAGGLPLARDQLAAAMNQSPAGGSFNIKVSTARIFGVLDTTAGKYTLTDLGFEIADSGRQREAMVTAFLNVELYKRAYEEFRGKRLPPRPHGLENAFISFGVSPKQATTARQIFDRSARKAGFFPNAEEDRLVMPFGLNGDAGPTSNDSKPVGRIIETAIDDSVGFSDAPRPAPTMSVGIHKSILGMLDELPPPKAKWNKADQADWLEAMATLFQVIYKSDGLGIIEVKFTPIEIDL